MNDDILVIARNPVEMEKAQGDLIAWATNKITMEQADLKELEDSLVIAQRNRWRCKGDPMLIGRITQRLGGYSTRTISFLIAWFIDTKAL